MKAAIIILSAASALTQIASAQFISNFTTTGSVVGGPTGTANATGDAILTSITVAGTTYTDIAAAGGIFGANTAERLWANTLTDPGTSTAAVNDLNLATGTLNTNALYDISGASAYDLIFAFGNGGGSIGTGSGGQTPPASSISFFAADGTTLVGTMANNLFFQDPGTNSVRAPNIASLDLTRSNGGSLTGRTVSGFAFALTDVVLEDGSAIGDISLVNFNSGSSDYQDVGYASVPEPSSYALLAGLAGMCFTMLLRRHA